MRPPISLVFLLEKFALQTPGQQLLDRLLTCFPRDGELQRPTERRVTVCLKERQPNADVERRTKDFGLARSEHAATTLAQADAVLVVPDVPGSAASEKLIDTALQGAPNDSSIFVYGPLGPGLAAARRQINLAASRRLPLLAGTELPVTWRLPQVDVKPGTRLTDALVVVQGGSPRAELDALECLLPVIERRAGGETGVRRVHRLEDGALWKAGERKRWSWTLLAAALSRSDSPQGDAVKDGRTQDLAGLGLVPKLARNPRGWLVEHRDGLRSALLVLDGVVADYNFAVMTASREIISAQILRPPAPAQQAFSGLAAVVEDFFRTGKPPWPANRSVLEAGLLETFTGLQTHGKSETKTPDLAIRYQLDKSQ